MGLAGTNRGTSFLAPAPLGRYQEAFGEQRPAFQLGCVPFDRYSVLHWALISRPRSTWNIAIPPQGTLGFWSITSSRRREPLILSEDPQTALPHTRFTVFEVLACRAVFHVEHAVAPSIYDLRVICVMLLSNDAHRASKSPREGDVPRETSCILGAALLNFRSGA